jgi:hypothetical protein
VVVMMTLCQIEPVLAIALLPVLVKDDPIAVWIQLKARSLANVESLDPRGRTSLRPLNLDPGTMSVPIAVGVRIRVPMQTRRGWR